MKEFISFTSLENPICGFREAKKLQKIGFPVPVQHIPGLCWYVEKEGIIFVERDKKPQNGIYIPSIFDLLRMLPDAELRYSHYRSEWIVNVYKIGPINLIEEFFGYQMRGKNPADVLARAIIREHKDGKLIFPRITASEKYKW